MRSGNGAILAFVAAVAAYTGATPQGAVIDADALPTLRVKEELRVGSADDPKIGFNAILAVDVDRDGQMFVYESQDREIRVLARDGRAVRTIGRRGSGPGEFTAVSAIGVVGDTVWAFELTQNGRLNVFRRNGTLISSNRATAVEVPLHNGAIGFVYPLAMRDDGRFISQLALSLPRGIANNIGASDTVMVPRVRFAVSGNVIDTIGWEPVPPPDGPVIPPRTGLSNVVVNGVSYVVPQPPTDNYIRTELKDGSVIVIRRRATSAQPAEFDVARFDLAGKGLPRIRFRYRPGRYQGAVLDTIAMRPVSLKNSQPNDAAFKAVRAAMVYPAFASAVYAVWPANDGSVWLRREDNAGPRHRWIVIERSGAVRGVVEIPRSARPMWARGDTLLAADADALGVPWLVRYRVGKT